MIYDYRHGNIINAMSKCDIKTLNSNSECGFLTSENRFLNHKEARDLTTKT